MSGHKRDWHRLRRWVRTYAVCLFGASLGVDAASGGDIAVIMALIALFAVFILTQPGDWR